MFGLALQMPVQKEHGIGLLENRLNIQIGLSFNQTMPQMKPQGKRITRN